MEVNLEMVNFFLWIYARFDSKSGCVFIELEKFDGRSWVDLGVESKIFKALGENFFSFFYLKLMLGSGVFGLKTRNCALETRMNDSLT